MRLEIERIEFKNFLSFGSRWQKVDFLPGVNIVLGLDKDREKSNGAGKSSFLETIPFALFGQVHKNIKKEQIVNWKNKKACEVVLYFKVGDKQYKVVRGIKPNKFDIYQNNQLIDKPHTAKLYQDILNDIIGLNFQTFMSLVHSNINSSNPILSMSKPDKRKIVEKIFGLEIYTDLDKICNEKRRLASEKIREIDNSMSFNIKSIEETGNRITDLEKRVSSLSDSKIKLNELLEKLNYLKDKSEYTEDDLREISKDIESLEMNMVFKNNLISLIENKSLHTKSKIKFFESNLKDIREKFIKNQNDIREIESLIHKWGDIESLEKNIEEIETKENILSIDINVLNKEKISIELSIQKCRIIINDCNDKIKSLSGKSECPTCGQKVDDNSNFCSDVEIKKEEAMNEKSILEKKKSSLSIDLMNIEERLYECKFLKKELRDIKDKIQKSNANLYLTSIKNDEDRLLKLIKKYKGVESKLKCDKYKKLINEVQIISKDISLRNEKLLEIKGILSQIEKTEKEIERLQERVDIEEKNKEEIRSLIVVDNNKIKVLRNENVKSGKKKDKLQEVIDYFDFIKNVCKDENAKQIAISSMMPYLNKQTNKYLSDVNYNFYILLNKWIEAEIKGPGIINGSYGSLSGGEARGIDLALQFAFLDIARVQAGIFPDILVFDELLDSSVDSKGIEKLMEIIKSKQSDENLKLFLISHRPEIEEIDFDNVYFVEKNNSYSNVKCLQ